MGQKCKKRGTSTTSWVNPKTIWRRFADHPAKSLRARLGPESRDGASLMPRASTGSWIKAKTSLASSAGYPLNRKLSIVDRDPDRICCRQVPGSVVDSGDGNRQLGEAQTRARRHSPAGKV